MSRIPPVLLVATVFPLVSAFSPPPEPAAPPLPVLNVAEKDSSYRKSCLKLRRCRSKYTYCFNQIEKNPRSDQWSAMRTACVDKYKICIKQNFKSGELTFERWFVPEVNCG